MKFQITVPGKLLILGEYAVLEGSPALVVAVNRHCTVTVTTRSSATLILQAVNLDLPELSLLRDDDNRYVLEEDPSYNTNYSNYRYCIEAIRIFQRNFPEHVLPSATISVDTSEFYHHTDNAKIGLGSSAAVTIATLRALFELTNTQYNPPKFFSMALKAHRAAQEGKGSGVDIAASIYGGLLQYIKPTSDSETVHPIESIPLPDNLFIIPVWTGYSVSTREFVGRVKRAQSDSPEAYQLIMRSLHDLASLGIENLQGGRINYFLEIVQEYGNVMGQLGQLADIDILSKVHREIREFVEQSGGVYKPSGAGGGDIGIAITTTPEMRQRIIESLGKKSYTVLDLTINQKGVNIRNYTKHK